jgi:outer membrane receptor protein involved in Fe transport
MFSSMLQPAADAHANGFSHAAAVAGRRRNSGHSLDAHSVLHLADRYGDLLVAAMNVFKKKATYVLWAMVLGCLLWPSRTTAQTAATVGRLECTAFVVDSEGRSVVPGAKVVLSGPSEFTGETNAEGKCLFAAVPAGTYAIEVQFPGLEAAEFVTVKGGAAIQVELELKPAAVKSEISVTASEAPSVSTETAAPTAQTIPENIVKAAPNPNDRTESVLPLIPGVVRGPDGRINMKGARNTQSGALVNSANVTDPATGAPGIDVPIDVVQSVQVISNPYDPQYGKLTGAVSTVETKTSNYEKPHFSIQNIFPRMRVRDGSIVGIGGATPRMTFTGPLLKDKVAFTQSLEYRFIRTPVNSLPGSVRDTTFEGVNSYTQLDLNLTNKQTATVAVAMYPQKLKYAGLNTFTPQTSASDYHQRGHQVYAQHRYAVGNANLLTSQFSYKTFDADVTPYGSGPFQLGIETTAGQYFNSQTRRSTRVDWQETYQFAPKHFWGTHQWKFGLDYAHSSYDSNQTFRPVDIVGVSGTPVERITFAAPNDSSIAQNEITWFASDEWTVLPRLTVTVGARFDRDSITDSNHIAPRGSFALALTGDRKTLLKGGAGIFYDRVPLMIASFPYLPGRTMSLLDLNGRVTSSTSYQNQVVGGLHNPKSKSWDIALSREVMHGLTVEAGYEWRRTTRDFVVSSDCAASCILALENRGEQSYREFQIRGRYQFLKHTLNASYVRSKAYGDLNDFFQFYGNLPKAVVQPDGRGRLSYDAPNRVLAWGEFQLPWKFTALPVVDVHTGFPYSVQDVYREYVGQRNSKRFPRFQSVDLQVLHPLKIKRLKGRAGFTVFNLLGHYNPRDVQTIQESPRFGQFFNDAWREYRGKLVFEF